MRLERHDRIEPIAAAWDELADRVGAPPWLRPGWLVPWYAAFGGRSPLEIFAAVDSGRLRGVLPMLRRRGGLTALANWHTPEFAPVVDDAEISSALVDEALARRPASLAIGWAASDALEPVRAAARRARYLIVERTQMRSPYLRLHSRAGGATSDGAWKQPRASTVRRHRRKLEQQGELRADVERGIDNLAAGFAVEASGWKGEQGSAIISRPETRTFYEDVARWAAERGLLRLFFLRLDERAIAFVLALQDNGRLYYLKGGFEDALRRFGPGVIITHDMIAYAREHDLDSFEFLGGEDPWKLEWAEDVRERRLFQAFRRRPAGLVQWAAHAYGRPLAKRVVAIAQRR